MKTISARRTAGLLVSTCLAAGALGLTQTGAAYAASDKSAASTAGFTAAGSTPDAKRPFVKIRVCNKINKPHVTAYIEFTTLNGDIAEMKADRGKCSGWFAAKKGTQVNVMAITIHGLHQKIHHYGGFSQAGNKNVKVTVFRNKKYTVNQ
jgi:hypothetical protein